ncbi:MAG: DUF1574 family protein [Leptonema sp. (in: bacteria)]
MEKLKNSFLLVLFLGFLFFITDKLFLIPEIKKISMYYKKVEIFFYESRYDLFEFFKKQEKNNYALIFGSSRSGMFIPKDFKENISFDVDVYNFSAPLAGTSFYYYWLERFLQEMNKKPKFILMELDAINLGEPSLRISLPFSYDPSFVIRHLDFYRDLPPKIPNHKEFIKDVFSSRYKGFNADEVDSYFVRYFFIIGRYEIHPMKIWENLKKLDSWNPQTNQMEKIPIYKIINKMKEKHIQSFYETYGGIPIEFYTKIPEENLERDAQKIFLRIFPEPKISTTQLIFLRNILETCKKQQIPLIIYKPPMTVYANQILKKYNFYNLEFIDTILTSYPNTFYIDTSHLNCNEFTDSVHLSPRCYSKLTNYIFSKVIQEFYHF